ncbi:phosphopantetheine adenylyltransferase [Sphingobacteriales bacterium UPWRP_1]|nr:hypothetical protein BVG80_16720 [Sphingobacteriales bacterium TSM_CSM]PSJ74345.1 phosphopantetheine adenylyltransferase [Sphingobacteriales bacterium UPWRP_1]
MELIYRVILFAAGIINLLPAVLAFFPGKIPNSYGIELPDANYELLLRHRAVLFGIIGGLMMFSAVTKKFYEIATVFGLISMTSFILLYFLIGKDINSELRKVMLIDMIAAAILLIGCIAFLLTSNSNR